ncbi:MAG TPA: hypothetical protein VN673_05315, partial [Clostridia bacterium]|nr:hypothetical protein [Clostridia bacterium]
MKTELTILKVIPALCCMILSTSAAEPPCFRVEGEMVATLYTPSGSVQQTIPSKFQVSVRGPVWQIIGTFPNSNYTVSGCDGTNIYTILHDLTQTNSSEPDVLPGSVSPEQFPTDVAWQTAIPWVAFASAHYLDNSKDGFLPGCWGQPRNNPEMWILRNRIVRSQVAPHLPLEITYVVDQKLQAAAKTNAHLLSALPDKEIYKAVFQYRPEFACGEYRVKSKTNWNGLELPLEFEVIRYYPKYTSTAEYQGPAVINAFRGKVHHITSALPSELMPKANGAISVADFRYSKRDIGVDFITYVGTNGTFPLPSEVHAEDLLKEKVSSAKKNLKYFLKRKHG